MQFLFMDSLSSWILIGSSISKGNIGVGFGAIQNPDNQSEIEDRLKKEVLKSLSPEFVNRLDEIIVFKDFDEDNFIKIIDLHYNELKSKLKTKGYNLFINKKARLKLCEEVLELKDGARPVARILQNKIIDPLSEELLKNSSKDIKIRIFRTFFKKGNVFNTLLFHQLVGRTKLS